jgi:hypothetical protein
LRIADCGLRIADCGLRIADCGLRIADCGLRINYAILLNFVNIFQMRVFFFLGLTEPIKLPSLTG